MGMSGMQIQSLLTEERRDNEDGPKSALHGGQGPRDVLAGYPFLLSHHRRLQVLS